MFHPVGHQPSTVYWRRRLVLVAGIVVLIVLVVLTVRTMTSHASGTRAAGDPPGGPSHTPAAPSTSGPSPTGTPTSDGPATKTSKREHRHHGKHRHGGHKHRHGHRHHHGGGPDPSSSPTGSGTPTGPSGSSTSSAPPQPCTPKDLDVQAVVGAEQYHVGDNPELALEVTNVGSADCVQDLGAGQVLLRIYNGESRVWSSHDCSHDSASKERTLMVGEPVRISLHWSGLTSRPGCAADERQRVGAGIYTLYATLAGESGKAAQFSIV